MPKAVLIALNIFYHLLTAAVTALHFLVVVPLTLLLSPPLRGGGLSEAARLAAWLYGRIALASLHPFLRVEKRGMGDIPREGGAVVIFNHKSPYDIHVMSSIPSPRLAFAAKGWPFRLPAFSTLMRMAEYIDVERLGDDEFLEAGEKLLKKGVFVCVAPEGRRSPDGRLGKFGLGAFKLAQRTGAPIVPVILEGMERFEFHSFPLTRPASVVFEALPPIRPENFDPELGALEMRKLARKLYMDKPGDKSQP